MAITFVSVSLDDEYIEDNLKQLGLWEAFEEVKEQALVAPIKPGRGVKWVLVPNANDIKLTEKSFDIFTGFARFPKDVDNGYTWHRMEFPADHREHALELVKLLINTGGFDDPVTIENIPES